MNTQIMPLGFTVYTGTECTKYCRYWMDTHSAVKISLSFILLAAVVQYDPVNVSNIFEIIKAKVMNVSRKDIESCIKANTRSTNEDLKHEGWKRVEELAKDSRIWKYDAPLLSREILVVGAPRQLFNYAANILKWVLLNAEKDIRTYPIRSP